jgi:hypothetical protein
MTYDGKRYAMVVYDIPSRLPGNINPSRGWRRFGFRVNLSCWIIPLDRLVAANPEAISSAGGDVKIVRFDESESAKIIDMARATITKDMLDEHAKVESAISRFRAEVASLVTGEKEEWKQARGRVCRALRQAQRFADDAFEAAVAFDLLQDVQQHVVAVHALVKAQSKVYQMLDAEALSRVKGAFTLPLIKEVTA